MADQARLDDEALLHIAQQVPWTVVFEFMDGVDAARATMACKSNNGIWTRDSINIAMKSRLRAREVGRMLLLERQGGAAQVEQRNVPLRLPKLVFSMDHVSRTDGVFQSIDEPKGGGVHRFWKYFRLYPDGLVIGVTSSGTPEQIKRWFHREREHAVGRYICDGPMVSFSTTSKYGTVDYTGRVRTKDWILRLQAHSHINGRDSETDYVFVKIPEWEKV